jgi:hypothetical protein
LSCSSKHDACLQLIRGQAFGESATAQLLEVMLGDLYFNHLASPAPPLEQLAHEC